MEPHRDDRLPGRLTARVGESEGGSHSGGITHFGALGQNREQSVARDQALPQSIVEHRHAEVERVITGYVDERTLFRRHHGIAEASDVLRRNGSSADDQVGVPSVRIRPDDFDHRLFHAHDDEFPKQGRGEVGEDFGRADAGIRAASIDEVSPRSDEDLRPFEAVTDIPYLSEHFGIALANCLPDPSMSGVVALIFDGEPSSGDALETAVDSKSDVAIRTAEVPQLSGREHLVHDIIVLYSQTNVNRRTHFASNKFERECCVRHRRRTSDAVIRHIRGLLTAYMSDHRVGSNGH
ncbi:hypothetical protein [Brevibacterium casei]|uniref:hypothetical protein n=1 Tax=Brevibacterium casei TaxID=33889 RepID=UPI001595956D|nr:hypothetical protein [Brevibacterium casei]